jgi:exopolyphosphatase/guanosine-5'-triphosphate,3'-diphosphate pyrophosphatase
MECGARASAGSADVHLAGAVVGHTVMKLIGLKEVTICPWAIREGVLLRHIEDGPSWWTDFTQPVDSTLSSVPSAVPLRIAHSST